MLLIMAGATVSATGSFRGSVAVPQGLNFDVGDVMTLNGFLSTPMEVFNTEVHVNKFYMDYYDSGVVSSTITSFLLAMGWKRLVFKSHPLSYSYYLISFDDLPCTHLSGVSPCPPKRNVTISSFSAVSY